jgi:hypothetical protein
MGNRMGVTAGSAWTALLAGLGWLLSGALYGLLTWFSVLPASFARVLAPETVQSSVWQGVMPWPVVIPLLSALTLVGLTAGLLQFALPRSTVKPATAHAAEPAVQQERRPAPFMAVWLCIVLASFATSMLWSAGTVLAQWPPARVALLFNSVEPELLSAGYWGIVWGWVPALAGTFAARRRQGTPRPAPGIRPPKRLTWIGATAASAALLVAAAPLSAAATRALRPAQATPSPVATQPAVVYGSPNVGPAHQAPAADWCSSDQVALSAGEPDAATGHRGLAIRLVNTGGAPCVLNSYPDLAFNDTAGWAMDVLLVHGGSFMTTDPGAHTITVLPGAAAEAFLGWNAMAGAGDTRVGTLLTAPYAGATRQSSAITLDIVNGGAVAVTAWSLAQPAG